MISPKLAGKTMSSRRTALLKASIEVFARFGYRKASMDEVARAADVSRQGLYLQFANKKALFSAVVDYALAEQLAAAQTALAKGNRTLEERLTTACDEWSGRYVDVIGSNAADLIESSVAITGKTLSKYEALFEQALADAIANSGLAAFYASVGLSPMDVAQTLHMAARGLKDSCKSRKIFVSRMAVAVRLLCAPLTATA